MSAQGPLRIIFAGFGSRGEIHPLLGTARELKARGHEISLIAPAPYAKAAQEFGFAFSPLGPFDQFERFMAQEKLWRFPWCFPLLAAGAADVIEPAFNAVHEHHRPGRTVLVMQWLMFGARIAQEKLGLPGVSLHPSPAVLRSAVAPARLPPLPVSASMPAWWNRACFALSDVLLLDVLFAKPVNAFRARQGLPPMRRMLADWIHSPDRVVGLFPDWFVPPQPDWPQQAVLTGFPLCDIGDEAALDRELLGFLDAGEPPVAITFGSGERHAQRSFAAAVAACRILGRRALLLTPYRQNLPAELPGDSYHAAYAAFGSLLPRCAAIIHHGGIGTMAQALAAGIPQVIVPVAFDQVDNGMRAARLGAATVLPPRSVNGRTIAASLRRLDEADHAAACAAAKRRLTSASAPSDTADWVERTFRDSAAAATSAAFKNPPSVVLERA